MRLRFGTGSTWFYQVDILPRITLRWDAGHIMLIAFEWLFWTLYWHDENEEFDNG